MEKTELSKQGWCLPHFISHLVVNPTTLVLPRASSQHKAAERGGKDILEVNPVYSSSRNHLLAWIKLPWPFFLHTFPVLWIKELLGYGFAPRYSQMSCFLYPVFIFSCYLSLWNVVWKTWCVCFTLNFVLKVTICVCAYIYITSHICISCFPLMDVCISWPQSNLTGCGYSCREKVKERLSNQIDSMLE